jgi:hypothetical protein
MDLVIPTAFQLAIHVPQFAIWIVGIYLAVSRRHEHPTGYPLAAIAFALLLVVPIISVIVTTALPGFMAQRDMSAMQIGMAFSIFSVFSIIISTVAWILVLIALFRRRAM